MALKGLTAEDRASWEKKYAYQLQGRTPQEIENAWVNFHISETHINDADYNKIKDLSIEEKEAYYNAHIQGDTAEKPTKSKEEVDAMVQEALPNNLVNKLSQDKLEGTSPIEKDDILSPFYDVEASEKVEKDKEARNAQENQYKVTLGKYDELYKRDALKARDGENMVKAVAQEVSPHYKMFKDTHLIPSDKQFWQDESKKFLANMETYGEETATQMLYSNLKEVTASRQTLSEKWSAGFNMLGADALSSILFITGAVTSPGAFAEKLIRGAYKDTPWYQLPQQFLDTFVDNPISRYSQDVLTQGAWTPSQIAEQKKIGLSKKPILATEEQENTLFNANTMPELLGQYGFTLGTMGVGVGLGAGTSAIMNAARARTLAGTAQKTAQTSQILYQQLTRLRAVESGITRYGIPALLGTGEGVQLGLETKIRVLEDGNAYVENIYRKQLEEEFSKKYNEEFEYRFQQALYYYRRTTSLTPMDPELGGGFQANTTQIKSDWEIANEVLDQIYNETVASLSGSYQKMQNQVEQNATKSGIITTGLVSGINGILYATVAASMFNTGAPTAIRSSKILKPFTSKPMIRVSQSGQATAVFSPIRKAVNIAKAPLGQGLEEEAQYEIEEAAYGGAANNIATFTQHENGGNGNAEVGDWYANDITAAIIAAGNGIGSKEFIQSGVYGALGSVVSVAMPHRGKAANGTKLKNPIARGYTIDGNRESNLDIVKRLMPLTSPIYAGYKENKALQKDAELTADEINKWIQDPENQAKFSSVNGTINWMKTIQDAADSGDEFGVRNGQLGKSVHDALMLEKIQGTELHDAIMTQINEVVNLQEGTKEANDYVEAMRNRTDTKAETENMSDKEVIDLLKKNANKMVSRMETVQKYGKEVENLLGDLDIDTKHSLVYARMQIQDWKERSKKIAYELSRLDIKSSTDRSSLTADAKQAIAKHGSLTKAQANKTALEGKLETLKQDIKILKKKKKLSTAEEETLQSKKIELSRTEKNVKLLGNLGETEQNDQLLNESEIMELDPATRAAFLNPTERTKFSQAQQNVIENLINQGTIDETEFLNKVRDAAKIETSGSKYLKEYNAVLANPKVFSIYTAIAKDQAAKAIQRRRYDALKNIEDYKEFSVAMDQLLQDGSQAEKQNIISWFRKEETNIPEGTQSNFGKYMVKRGKTAEVLENAARGEVLVNAQGNDVDLFTHASTYLEDNDIDITDTDAVTEALSAVDEVGNNLFQKYVEKINANVEQDSKTVFTSPTQVIQMVKDVVDEYKKNDANAKANSTPINVTQNPQENSSVPTPEQPANAVSNVAEQQVADNGVGTPGTSIPGATLTGSGQVIQESKSVGEQATEGQEDKKEESTSEIAKSFQDNSTEVRTAAQEIESLITSSPELTEEQKEYALEIIKELGDTKYQRVEDLANAILDKATWLLNNGNKEIATQLNNFAPRLIISAKDKKLSQQRAEDYARQRELNVVEKSTAMQSILGLNAWSPVINLNANEVSTLDIQFLNDKFSMHEEDANFSPLLKYLQDNKVEQFLNMDYLNKQTPVFFINDPQLTEAQRRAWKEQSNKELPAANASLVAVVKSANGTIEIKGERYQPIGIMPATSAKRYSGSNRLEIVRSQLNTEATEPYLVSDAEGIIETRLSRLPSAQPMEQLTENISTIESGMNSLSFPERSQLEGLSRAEQRSNPIYRKMRKKFFEALGVSRVGRPKLIFNISNLLKQGAVTTIDIFIQNVSKSKCINTGQSIISMLKGGDLKVLEANSRIRRWSGKLGDIIGNINESNITILPNGQPTQQTENTLSDLAKDLNKQLSNFLNISDFTFNVEYAGVLEGNNVYKISMVSSIGETIELGNFSKNITNQQKLNILKNMILDQSGKVRMLNDKYELVKWQIPYNDFQNLDDSKSKSNAEDIYDDGILQVSKERLTYNVKRLTVEAPYTMEGNKRVFAQVTNKDNANISGTSPVSQAQVETDTAVIDTNTGTIKEGKEKEEVKQAVVEAQKKAELISKGQATVTQTSEGYKINGGIYRVVERQEKEDWKQHINITIKNIFSNFFQGKEMTEHPTMTIRAFEIFKGNIEAFKNGLTSKGITLIPKVIVTATLPDQTTKVAQEVHLGYDQNGNWHIYCPTMEQLSEAQQKEMASEIAYLSSNFASTYGLTIQDITIIPIDIAYPNANNNLRVENGVVFVNKKSVYQGARPILGSRKTFAMNDVATYNTKNLQDRLGVESTEESSKTEAVVTNTTATTNIDLTASYFGEESTDKTQQGKQYVPKGLKWGEWDKLGYNKESTLRNLLDNGITEEEWEEYSDAEKEAELKCKGRY